MATQQTSQEGPSKKTSQEGPSQPIDIGDSQIFDYEELQEATKFFNPSQRVGEGAFGVVYRGDLTDGRAVAIKELTVRDKKSIRQFFNEACLLSRLRHDNLVTLYGCTNPVEEKMLLVYEFAHNGAVVEHIHHRRFSKKALTWSQRVQIATQTAEALTYLHSLEPAIIHRDVKTDNILLDKNFNAKVADFGLCRLLPRSGAHVSTMSQGTQGYLPPESIQFGKITTKSDVYSFGVVLMELISSKHVLDYEERVGDEFWLVNLAFNKMKNDQLEQLVDLELGYLEDPNIFCMINSVAQLAYESLQSAVHKRPSVMDVLTRLKGISNEASTSIFDDEELHEATKLFESSEGVDRHYPRSGIHGILRDGRAVVIKQLSPISSKKDIEQFFNEIRLISGLRHKNLVAIYGCTNLRNEKTLLVQEFMPNETVADHLVRKRFSNKVFTWPQRLHIAIETAEALAYLHSFQPPIIHYNVKTGNILLDNNLNVKVDNIGLFNLRSLGGSTLEHPDPECNQKNMCTTKCDVYGFGVVLMELIFVKPFPDTKRHVDEICLVCRAFEKMKNDRLKDLFDPELGHLEDPKITYKVNFMAQLACSCLADGFLRPPMTDVLKDLKQISDTDPSTSRDIE